MSKLGGEGHKCLFGIFKLEKDKRAIVSSLTFEKEKENVLEGGTTYREFELWFLVRERPPYL